VIVELTEEGKQLWDAAVGAQAEKESIVSSALGDREKRQLGTLRADGQPLLPFARTGPRDRLAPRVEPADDLGAAWLGHRVLLSTSSIFVASNFMTRYYSR
jgi:hypothetical protein